MSRYQHRKSRLTVATKAPLSTKRAKAKKVSGPSQVPKQDFSMDLDVLEQLMSTAKISGALSGFKPSDLTELREAFQSPLGAMLAEDIQAIRRKQGADSTLAGTARIVVGHDDKVSVLVEAEGPPIEVALSSRNRVAIAAPPGHFLMRLVSLLSPKSVLRRMIEEPLADMRDEHYEALANGSAKQARWIVVRGYFSITRAVALHVGFWAIVGKVIEMWRRE